MTLSIPYHHFEGTHPPKMIRTGRAGSPQTAVSQRLHCWRFGEENSVTRAALCIVGCWAEFLVPTHRKPVAPTPSSSVIHQNVSTDIPKCLSKLEFLWHISSSGYDHTLLVIKIHIKIGKWRVECPPHNLYSRNWPAITAVYHFRLSPLCTLQCTHNLFLDTEVYNIRFFF